MSSLKTEQDSPYEPNRYELVSSAKHSNAPYAYTQLNNTEENNAEETRRINGCGNDSNAKILRPWRNEILRQLGLAGPAVAVSVVDYLMSLVALVFVGHIGKVEYGGAALATSMATSMGYVLLMGMATAIETLCGQAYGAQEYHMLGTFLQQGLLVLLGACIPLSLIFITMEDIMIAFKQDPQMCKVAGKYALGLLPGLFAFSILQALARFLQVQNIVWPEVWSSAISLVFHVFTSWLMIYQMGWGYVGAAASTSLSLWVNVGILLLYIKVSGSCKNTWLGFSKNCIHGIKHFLKLSFSSSLMSCLDYWCFFILTLLAGWLPNPQREISALSICMNITSLYYMIPMGIGIAASLRVSNEIGAGQTEAARNVIFIAMGITFCQAIFVSITLFSTRNVLGRLFSNKKDVIRDVSNIVPIMSITAIVDGLQAVLSGVAVGCGWQNLGAYASFLSLYIVGLPTGIALAFVYHMGGKGLWIGITGGMLLQTLILLWITIFTSLQKQSAEAKARLEMIQRKSVDDMGDMIIT